ncbi:unannotated protein [freshwater metagenome]|uniref:Unannotated protein n=1 Tax=freshwater metagenome TaxID=449393 RepID=A0A6J7H4P8_9ZZZZ|nr:hypothetical protein [Actinomycetota bacterium]
MTFIVPKWAATFVLPKNRIYKKVRKKIEFLDLDLRQDYRQKNYRKKMAHRTIHQLNRNFRNLVRKKEEIRVKQSELYDLHNLLSLKTSKALQGNLNMVRDMAESKISWFTSLEGAKEIYRREFFNFQAQSTILDLRHLLIIEYELNRKSLLFFGNKSKAIVVDSQDKRKILSTEYALQTKKIAVINNFSENNQENQEFLETTISTFLKEIE